MSIEARIAALEERAERAESALLTMQTVKWNRLMHMARLIRMADVLLLDEDEVKARLSR